MFTSCGAHDYPMGIVYFIVVLRRVYRGTWAETLGRGTALLILYFAIFFVANLLLVFALLTLNIGGAGINFAAPLFNHQHQP